MKSTNWFAVAGVATAFLFLSGSVAAFEITPVGATASSEGVDQSADNLINSSGLDGGGGAGDLDDLHDNNAGAATMWHAAVPDNPFAVPALPQWVEFRLGGLYTLDAAYIWQMNQELLAPARGANDLEISVSLTPGGPFTSVLNTNLAAEDGSGPVDAQVVGGLGGVQARFVRFDITSAHSGLQEEFVGLSEVRFEGVPEPASAGLAICGLALGALRRKRR